MKLTHHKLQFLVFKIINIICFRPISIYDSTFAKKRQFDGNMWRILDINITVLTAAHCLSQWTDIRVSKIKIVVKQSKNGRGWKINKHDT